MVETRPRHMEKDPKGSKTKTEKRECGVGLGELVGGYCLRGPSGEQKSAEKG